MLKRRRRLWWRQIMQRVPISSWLISPNLWGFHPPWVKAGHSEKLGSLLPLSQLAKLVQSFSIPGSSPPLQWAFPKLLFWVKPCDECICSRGNEIVSSLHGFQRRIEQLLLIATHGTIWTRWIRFREEGHSSFLGRGQGLERLLGEKSDIEGGLFSQTRWTMHSQ